MHAAVSRTARTAGFRGAVARSAGAVSASAESVQREQREQAGRVFERCGDARPQSGDGERASPTLRRRRGHGEEARHGAENGVVLRVRRVEEPQRRPPDEDQQRGHGGGDGRGGDASREREHERCENRLQDQNRRHDHGKVGAEEPQERGVHVEEGRAVDVIEVAVRQRAVGDAPALVDDEPGVDPSARPAERPADADGEVARGEEADGRRRDRRPSRDPALRALRHYWTGSRRHGDPSPPGETALVERRVLDATVHAPRLGLTAQAEVPLRQRVDEPDGRSLAFGSVEEVGEKFVRALTVQEAVDEMAEVVLQARVVEARDHHVARLHPLAKILGLPANLLPVVVVSAEQARPDEAQQRAASRPAPGPCVGADELKREPHEQHAADAGERRRRAEDAQSHETSHTERREERARAA
jgi:hypothetical protein